MKPAYMYKIRRKSDGLFSSGGMDPDWSKKGKVWTSKGHLKNHFRLFNGKHWTLERRYPDNDEYQIIRYIPVEGYKCSIQDFINHVNKPEEDE